MGFDRVKAILDQAIADWAAVKGAPDLSGHDDGVNPPMAWRTKQELLSAWGHGHQLIQPEVIGNGQAEAANLIIDLRLGLGTPPRRMPKGGPYLSGPLIDEIAAWINGGCLD
jgi:hypothetical protein